MTGPGSSIRGFVHLGPGLTCDGFAALTIVLLAPLFGVALLVHARIGLSHLCRAMHPQRSLNGNLFFRQMLKREPWVELRAGARH
jgi:hypothetical protein